MSTSRPPDNSLSRVTRVDAPMEVADEHGLREAFVTHGGELLGFARRTLFVSGAAEDGALRRSRVALCR